MVKDEANGDSDALSRWELYRLLGEPARLKLLGLASEEELAIGELAELLGEPQPNVSRHVAPLRRANLLAERKHGTRVFVSVPKSTSGDPVVADALKAGRALAQKDGSLSRVAAIVRRRDEAVRAFFSQPRGKNGKADAEGVLPPELPAYLRALAPLIPHRKLAIDAGTGDGGLVEALAPVFDRVVAIDREAAQLSRAKARLARRGYEHVELVQGEIGSEIVRAKVAKIAKKNGVLGADAVFAARVLHHASRPAVVVEALASFARPGGAVIALEYAPHEDESLRDGQADVWLGFSGEELERLAKSAGLTGAEVHPIPAGHNGEGPDKHLAWHVLVAWKPKSAKT